MASMVKNFRCLRPEGLAIIWFVPFDIYITSHIIQKPTMTTLTVYILSVIESHYGCRTGIVCTFDTLTTSRHFITNNNNTDNFSDRKKNFIITSIESWKDVMDAKWAFFVRLISFCQCTMDFLNVRISK